MAGIIAHRNEWARTDLLTLPALVLISAARRGNNHVNTRHRCQDWLNGPRRPRRKLVTRDAADDSLLSVTASLESAHWSKRVRFVVLQESLVGLLRNFYQEARDMETRGLAELRRVSTRSATEVDAGKFNTSQKALRLSSSDLVQWFRCYCGRRFRNPCGHCSEAFLS